MPLKIKNLEEEDLEGLVEVISTTFPQDFDYGEGFSEEACYKFFERSLQDPNEKVYTAILNNKTVGFVYYINKPPTNGTILLEMMGVRKNYRRQGIGKRLLNFSDEKVVEDFKKKGINNIATIHLTTSEDNLAAQSLYLQCDYKKEGRIKELVGKGNTEIVMVKKVSDTAYRKDLWIS